MPSTSLGRILASRMVSLDALSTNSGTRLVRAPQVLGLADTDNGRLPGSSAYPTYLLPSSAGPPRDLRGAVVELLV